MLLKKKKNTSWMGLNPNQGHTYPSPCKDVEIMRKNKTTEKGFWYSSSKTGRTWIGEDNYRIKSNPVTHWRPLKEK